MLEQSVPLLQTTKQKLRLPYETVLPFGLVCHYPMDASTIYPGTGLEDTSGGLNHGSFGGTAPKYSDTDGGSGPGGLRLINGSGYATFPFPASIPTGTAARTFCCWIYILNFTTYLIPIRYGVFPGTTLFQVYIDKDSHQIVMTNGTTPVSSASSALTAGTWHHIAWVSFDGGGAGGYFWLDGAFESSGAFSLNTSASGDHYISYDGTTIYGDCLLRDWRVYNYGLSYGELRAIMAAGQANGLANSYVGQAESPVLAQQGNKARSYGYIM